MDSPRGLSGRIRAWRASVGSAIAGHPSGASFAALAAEPMLPAAAERPPPTRARRADGILAVAGATDGLSDREAYGALPPQLPTNAPPASQRRSPPPAAHAVLPARLLQLSEAARTAAALGWDVVSLAAPEERDVLLGDDLRDVAAALRDALAAAAGRGGVPERVLADAFAAFEELQYVLRELEAPPPPLTTQQAMQPSPMPPPPTHRHPSPTRVPQAPMARLPPPPTSVRATTAVQQQAPQAAADADTEKPLIEL